MTNNILKRTFFVILCLCVLLGCVSAAQAATLTITRQPFDAKAFVGQDATVSVTAVGEGLSYRWYYADPGSSVFGNSGTTTASYTRTMTAERSGRRVYCVITDASGHTVQSNTVTLTAMTPLKITRSPSNVTVASGKTASVSVTATGDGLEYWWFYKDVGRTLFLRSSASGPNYAMTMTRERNGRQVYCVVLDKHGNQVRSSTATLKLRPAQTVEITRHPVDVTVTRGKTATVSVAATGDGLSYRWYYADAGSSAFAKSGVATASYSLMMTSARNGRRVYCVVTDQYGNKESSECVTLSMVEPVKITRQPVDVARDGGKTATVSVAATGEGLSYSWYYADAGSTAFARSSVTTASYSLLMSSARDGRRVYCVVRDQYGNTVQSNTVTLSLAAPPKITRQPADVKVGGGKLASVSVEASGEGLSYRWYYMDLTASEFSKSSVTTATYSMYMTPERDGRQVYCVVTDKNGQTATSRVVMLEMP